MPRLLLPLLLLPLLAAHTACVRPRQLDPPGLALGVFHDQPHPAQTGRTLRGVGLVLQPGRVCLGLIRETTHALPTDRPAHFSGQAFAGWLIPDSHLSPLPKESHHD